MLEFLMHKKIRNQWICAILTGISHITQRLQSVIAWIPTTWPASAYTAQSNSKCLQRPLLHFAPPPKETFCLLNPKTVNIPRWDSWLLGMSDTYPNQPSRWFTISSTVLSYLPSILYLTSALYIQYEWYIEDTYDKSLKPIHV